ncbi:MAG TPA: hypothetical protein VLF94_05585 [Chlamydiales bacterium]|nr:hypothetical protein [Chlamydiales bacterium]
MEIPQGHHVYCGVHPSSDDPDTYGFLRLTVEGLLFSFYTQDVAGFPYGSDWEETIQVGCISDPSLNLQTGEDNSLITAVPPEWHAKLLDQLDERVRRSLRDKIEEISSHNRDEVARLKRYSQEYCDQLALSSTDLSILRNEDLNRIDNILTIEVDDRQFVFQCRGTYDEQIVIFHCKKHTADGDVISSEWHAKILGKLDEGVRRFLRDKINAVLSLYTQTLQHSQQYHAQLDRLFRNHPQWIRDLPKALKDIHFFPRDLVVEDCLKLRVEDKIFSLRANRFSGGCYGDRDTKDLIQVSCDNDPSLNRHTGGGTTSITAIPPEWHRKLLLQLEACVNRHLSARAIYQSIDRYRLL